MPIYKYKAQTQSGSVASGVVEAYDEFEAVNKIREQYAIVNSIQQVEEKENLLTRDILPAKVNLKALSLVCSQFASIMSAGMPVVRATALIADQTADKHLKKLLKQVAEDVAAGYGLAQSFENKGGKLLPATFIETVRAGEESGTLEVSFAKLKKYYESTYKVRASAKSAMMYPLFLLGLAVVVVAIVMGVAMPMFRNTFADLGADMPGITLAVIAFADFCSANWLWILVVILAIVLAIRFYINTERGHLAFAKLMIRIPILGNVTRMKGASELANTLSTLLGAGMPVVRAVEGTARVLSNYFMSTQLAKAVADLETGRRLGDCLKSCECFPDMLVEMAAMGEESGSLEEILGNIGAYYDGEVEEATKRALSMLQPSITVILGLIVGALVIALYMPMFTMYANM